MPIQLGAANIQEAGIVAKSCDTCETRATCEAMCDAVARQLPSMDRGVMRTAPPGLFTRLSSTGRIAESGGPSLSERDMLILYHYKDPDWPPARIAGVLGIKVEVVYQTIARAKKLYRAGRG